MTTTLLERKIQEETRFNNIKWQRSQPVGMDKTSLQVDIYLTEKLESNVEIEGKIMPICLYKDYRHDSQQGGEYISYSLAIGNETRPVSDNFVEFIKYMFGDIK